MVTPHSRIIIRMHTLRYLFLAILLNTLMNTSNSQNDMRLSSVQLNYLHGNKIFRNVLPWSDYYWPNSTLVYSIGKGLSKCPKVFKSHWTSYNIYSPKALSDYMSIMSAMADISFQTCVRFRRTYNLKEPQVILQKQNPAVGPTLDIWVKSKLLI